jgi:hypothetical protein
MTTTPQTHCPKCASPNREYGILKGFSEVRFYPGLTIAETVLGKPGEMVVGVACLKCGHIELILEKVPREYAERMEGKGTE